jgi:hypothetical protein
VASGDRDPIESEEATSAIRSGDTIMVGASGSSAPRQRTGDISLPDTIKVT